MPPRLPDQPIFHPDPGRFGSCTIADELGVYQWLSSRAGHDGLLRFIDEVGSNEIFLDDVFVPDEDVVGPVDGGRRVARGTVGNDSVSIGDGEVAPVLPASASSRSSTRTPTEWRAWQGGN